MEIRRFLQLFRESSWSAHFALGGSLAQACWYGGRPPKDVDLLTLDPGSMALLRQELQQHPGELLQFTTYGLRVDWIALRGFWLEAPTRWEGMWLVSRIDLACLKLAAINRRDLPKDRLDLELYFQDYSAEELRAAFARKFRRSPPEAVERALTR